MKTAEIITCPKCKNTVSLRPNGRVVSHYGKHGFVCPQSEKVVEGKCSKN